MSSTLIHPENDTMNIVLGNSNLFDDKESSIAEVNPQFENGHWNDEEHNKFLKGILLNGNNWEKTSQLVMTRSPLQIKSHMQKFIIHLTKKYANNELDKILELPKFVCEKDIELLNIKEQELFILKKYYKHPPGNEKGLEKAPKKKVLYFIIKKGMRKRDLSQKRPYIKKTQLEKEQKKLLKLQKILKKKELKDLTMEERNRLHYKINNKNKTSEFKDLKRISKVVTIIKQVPQEVLKVNSHNSPSTKSSNLNLKEKQSDFSFGKMNCQAYYQRENVNEVYQNRMTNYNNQVYDNSTFPDMGRINAINPDRAPPSNATELEILNYYSNSQSKRFNGTDQSGVNQSPSLMDNSSQMQSYQQLQFLQQLQLQQQLYQQLLFNQVQQGQIIPLQQQQIFNNGVNLNMYYNNQGNAYNPLNPSQGYIDQYNPNGTMSSNPILPSLINNNNNQEDILNYQLPFQQYHTMK